MAQVRLVSPPGSGISGDGATPVALVGTSDVVRAARAALDLAAGRRSPALVIAEPGCRVRSVAEWLHARTRGDQPILTIDCSAEGPLDIERRLFGVCDEADVPSEVEAVGRDSALLAAGAGTLVLDHIEELPSSSQRRLARVLRDGEVRPAAAGAPVPVACRLLASAPRDLDDEVRDGRFRGDLLRRFAACMVRVPALRQRSADIGPIIDRLVFDMHGAVRAFTQPAVTVLAALPWTRNIDELSAVLERVVEGAGPIVRQEDVLAHLPIDGAFTRFDTTSSLREARLRFERDYIGAVLERHHWRIPDAAAALGIERANLYRKIRQLRLSRPSGGGPESR